MSSPEQAEVVRAFRQELEGASFGLGQVNDNELECWLFQAGSDRVHLLQWCLGQLDPVLRDRFQNCDGKEAEKRTVEHVATYGICHKTDVILGKADRKDQIVLWKNMLTILQAVRAPKQSPTKGKNTSASVFLPTNSSFVKSKDFFDLTHMKVMLIPPELRCVSSAASKRDYEKELREALVSLEELQDLAANVSSDDEKSIADRTVQTSEDYEENFLSSYKRIQESYRHLVDSVFPVIKMQAENPIVDTLGCYIETLTENVSGFVQMLKSIENIHVMAGSLQESSLEGLKSSDLSPLQQYISKSHALVTETLSLWRIHNMV